MKKISLALAVAAAVPLSALALYHVVDDADAAPSTTIAATADTVAAKGGCLVRLSVDQKLEGVAWRCEAPGECVPWYLTRTAQARDVAESYLVWSPDGKVRCLVSENRESGAWKTEGNGILRLSLEQRLISIGWECPPGKPCELRFVTRLLRADEQPRGHTFSDGVTSYSIFETR